MTAGGLGKNRKMAWRRTGTWCAVAICVTFACTTRSMKRIELFSSSAEKGDYQKAIRDIRNSPKIYGNLNRFLYWFDLGMLFHYSAGFDSSQACFEKAEQVLDELWARSVTNEAASLLTNDNIRPYRGRRYEQVLLHQFLSFDYLGKNEFDESLVETRKVQLVFDRFQSKDKNRDKYNNDGMSHFLSSMIFDAQGERDNAAISLFQSVSAYQNGPVELPSVVRDVAYHRLIADGREEDVRQLGLSSPVLAGNVNGIRSDQTEIVLIGYAGKGPILDETVFWGTYVMGGMLIGYYRNPNGDTVAVVLPAPPLPESEIRKIGSGEATRAGRTFHIKFSLPTAVRRPSKVDRFSVRNDSAHSGITSTSLTDINRLLEQDIEDNRAATLLRTTIRVVLRTIAAQKAKQQLSTDMPIVNLLVSVGTDIAADQLEKADTRLSFLLPGAIHIARLPVEPGAHRIEASALGRNGQVIDSKVWENVPVKRGGKTFLFYPALM